MSFIAIDLKVIEGLSASSARAAGTNEDRVLAGLIRTWHRCWSAGGDVMTRPALAGVFGGERLDELIEALTADGFLEPRGDGSWRVKGAAKYLRVQAGRVLGGQKAAAAGNLKRGSKKLKSAIAGSSPQLVPASFVSALESPSSSPAASQLKLEKSPAAPQLPPSLSPNTEHRTPNTEKETHTHPLQALWNLSVPDRTKCPKWTKTEGVREKHANARLREHPELPWWADVFDAVVASDFLSGRNGAWRASPDWIINPANLTKVVEGNYANGPPGKGPVNPSTQNHTRTGLVENFGEQL